MCFNCSTEGRFTFPYTMRRYCATQYWNDKKIVVQIKGSKIKERNCGKRNEMEKTKQYILNENVIIN